MGVGVEQREYEHDAPVQMSHEVLECRVVRVWERVHALMQSDVACPLALVPCEKADGAEVSVQAGDAAGAMTIAYVRPP